MAELVYIPINPITDSGCANNCVLILGANESVTPSPNPLPPSGMEWVYDIDNQHVSGTDNLWVYTSLSFN